MDGYQFTILDEHTEDPADVELAQAHAQLEHACDVLRRCRRVMNRASGDFERLGHTEAAVVCAFVASDIDSTLEDLEHGGWPEPVRELAHSALDAAAELEEFYRPGADALRELAQACRSQG